MSYAVRFAKVGRAETPTMRRVSHWSRQRWLWKIRIRAGMWSLDWDTRAGTVLLAFREAQNALKSKIAREAVKRGWVPAIYKLRAHKGKVTWVEVWPNPQAVDLLATIAEGQR